MNIADKNKGDWNGHFWLISGYGWLVTANEPEIHIPISLVFIGYVHLPTVVSVALALSQNASQSPPINSAHTATHGRKIIGAAFVWNYSFLISTLFPSKPNKTIEFNLMQEDFLRSITMIYHRKFRACVKPAIDKYRPKSAELNQVVSMASPPASVGIVCDKLGSSPRFNRPNNCNSTLWAMHYWS
uniref:Uncharacterized protein n=1 Tax=Schistocephalus solidus TaxID=70667 RepID=A0A0X3NWI9_SCHSO